MAYGKTGQLSWQDPQNGGIRMMKIQDVLVIGRDWHQHPPGYAADQVTPLVLADAQVSRFHAWIHWDGAHFWITDHQSSNGTWVNGVTVTQRQLVDNDVVRIGPYSMRFNESLAPMPAPSPAPGLGGARFSERPLAIAAGQPEPIASPPVAPPAPPVAPPVQPLAVTPVSVTYALRCPAPHCHKAIPHTHLVHGCPWCGHSLADAVSVFIPRQENARLEQLLPH